MPRLLILLILLVCLCSPFFVRVGETEATDDQKAVLSLTFDDGRITAYTEALPCMQNRSLPATVYCVSDWIGSEGALTRRQIMDLQDNYGWEIGSHTENHVNLQRIGLDVIEAQVSGAYSALTAFGARIYGLAYPFGQYDDNAITVAEKYHVYARAAQMTFCQNLPPKFYDGSGRYFLRCSTWDQKNLSQVEDEISTCIANRSWLIGLNHGIDGQNQMNRTTWNSLMGYIRAKVDAGQLLVATVFDALEYYRDRTGEMFERFTAADSDQECLDFRRDVFKNVIIRVIGQSVTRCLLTNSGFEDVRNGSPSLPQYWRNDTPSGTVGLAAEVFHSGNSCLLLNRTAATGNMISYTSDQNGSSRTALLASPDRKYTLNIWVNSNTTLAKADLAFFNGSRWIRSSTTISSSSVGWQKITVSSACPSDADSVSVYLYIGTGSTGWAYFDDVMLTCDTDPSATHIADTATVRTTDPRFKVGDDWYNYSGILDDGQEKTFVLRTLLGGKTDFCAQIAGSNVAVTDISGTRVLYVDKAWVTTVGDTILFEKLFDNISTKVVIYGNIKIQFISGVNYALSEFNTEGGDFYFAETSNYFAFNRSQPYISYCTNNVTQASFSDEKLVFTVGASGTSTGSAKICVGSRGKPSGVNGNSEWNYEENTGTLIICFTSSQSRIEVSWVADPQSLVQTELVFTVITGIAILAAVSLVIIRRHKGKLRAHEKDHDPCARFLANQSGVRNSILHSHPVVAEGCERLADKGARFTPWVNS